MTLLNTINVGGTDYGITGAAILGSCATPAGSEIKVCTFTDNFELKAGDMLLVKFTYANTYGDGSTTYPKLQINGTNYVMRRADGNYLQSGEWGNNATLTFLFDGTDFILPAGSGSAKGSGVPLGAILAIHSNQVPDGYLPCNGVQFDTAQFAALYALLGDDHTPDLRECNLVGIGQNATDTIAAHDVYTLGQFKDDQIKSHSHAIGVYARLGSAGASTRPSLQAGGDSYGLAWQDMQTSASEGGTTTHGKQKGVNYIIKATSGLPDDQQDYILNQLAPVDVVALNNVHSVTSNAVAEAFADTLFTTDGWYMIKISPTDYIGIKQEIGYRNAQGYYLVQPPAGFAIKIDINVDAFQVGNTARVVQASHVSNVSIAVYLDAGNSDAYQIRTVAILTPVST